MRRATVLLLLGALLLSGCASGRDAVDPAAAGRNRFVAGDGTTQVVRDPGERPAGPTLTGELLGGGSFEPAAYRGKVVVVNFWASWCAPCRLETPELVELHKATHSRGVEFLGINIRDDRDKARAFEESFGVPYPSLFDPAGRTTLAVRDLGVNGIPATIVIDREGRVAAVFRKALLRKELEPVVLDVAAEP